MEKEKLHTSIFFCYDYFFSRIAADQRKLQQIVGDCLYGRFSQNTRSCARCVKRTLRLGGSKCSELAGQPCVISPQKTREKKRKTSTEEDRLECLAPHDASARTVATTFKLSVWLGLVGIFFIFKPSHEMFYISIVTSLLRSLSRFRLRSGYFSKDSLSCEARSA